MNDKKILTVKIPERMNLKKLKLGIDFNLELSDDNPISEEETEYKRLKEAAGQLGINIETEK